MERMREGVLIGEPGGERWWKKKDAEARRALHTWTPATTLTTTDHKTPDSSRRWIPALAVEKRGQAMESMLRMLYFILHSSIHCLLTLVIRYKALARYTPSGGLRRPVSAGYYVLSWFYP